jgi:hypothetical protein
MKVFLGTPPQNGAEIGVDGMDGMGWTVRIIMVVVLARSIVFLCVMCILKL